MTDNNKQTIAEDKESKQSLEGRTITLILPLENFQQLQDLQKLYRSTSMSHTIRLAIEDMLKVMKKKVAMEEEIEEGRLG